MSEDATAKGHATISAVKIHGPNSPTPGRVEDLGVIASTEDGGAVVLDAPTEAKKGVVRQLREAWVEGWHEGKEQKDEESGR